MRSRTLRSTAFGLIALINVSCAAGSRDFESGEGSGSSSGGGGASSTTEGSGGASTSTSTSTSSEGGAGGEAGGGGAGGDGGFGGAASTSTTSTTSTSNGCGADECLIEGACVAPGTPSASDPCSVCVAANDSTGWWHDATSPACDGKPYWSGVTRALPTTPYGNEAAISCHNCYVTSTSSAASLTGTLTTIHDAQSAGADLIELDLKAEGGVVYVDHNDAGTTTGAVFSSVVADNALKTGSQLLYIEFKETLEDESYVRSVLTSLKSNGYAKAGRPVMLRAFRAVSHNLIVARRLLATADFVAMRPYVRLQVLINATAAAVDEAKAEGMHGVEFQYQSASLFGALDYAKSLDLGTNLWTIPTSMGEVFLASLRDEADALTTDYPLDRAKSVVIDKNGLLYFNASEQGASATSYYRTSSLAASTLTGNASTAVLGAGSSLFGSTLVFSAAQSRYAGTYDAVTGATDGYLVSAVARFDQPIIASNTTSVLIGKAQTGGFSLELYNDGTGTVLRFGVFVSGTYRYATYPASKLSTSQSYIVTGAYDGDGGVYIWVNNALTDSTSGGSFTGGVTPSSVPVLLGADPETTGQRYYFSGSLRSALVQRWANH